VKNLKRGGDLPLLHPPNATSCPPLPADPWFWNLCASDMRWLRNQVVAPLTEELVFRACMLPMLVPCAGPALAVVTCPLFFGVGESSRCQDFLRVQLFDIFISTNNFKKKHTQRAVRKVRYTIIAFPKTKTYYDCELIIEKMWTVQNVWFVCDCFVRCLMFHSRF